MTVHNDLIREDGEDLIDDADEPQAQGQVSHIIQHHVVADLPGVVFLGLATVIGDLFGSAELGFGIGATLVLIGRGTS